jgi:hypothetical protein
MPLVISDHFLKRVGHTFVGIPERSPKVKLLDAAANAVGAASAKQVIAYYVLESYNNNGIPNFNIVEFRSRWIIHAWGFRPFMPTLPPGLTLDAVPENARNHMRTFIDPEDGEFCGADTIPQPEV